MNISGDITNRLKVEDTLLGQFAQVRSEEVHSPENRWFTAQALHTDPNESQLVAHYQVNGGPRHLLDVFAEKHPEVSLSQ